MNKREQIERLKEEIDESESYLEVYETNPYDEDPFVIGSNRELLIKENKENTKKLKKELAKLERGK